MCVFSICFLCFLQICSCSQTLHGDSGCDYDQLSDAAHCRAQWDWLIGINGTASLRRGKEPGMPRGVPADHRGPAHGSRKLTKPT